MPRTLSPMTWTAAPTRVDTHTAASAVCVPGSASAIGANGPATSAACRPAAADSSSPAAVSRAAMSTETLIRRSFRLSLQSELGDPIQATCDLARQRRRLHGTAVVLQVADLRLQQGQRLVGPGRAAAFHLDDQG